MRHGLVLILLFTSISHAKYHLGEDFKARRNPAPMNPWQSDDEAAEGHIKELRGLTKKLIALPPNAAKNILNHAVASQLSSLLQLYAKGDLHTKLARTKQVLKEIALQLEDSPNRLERTLPSTLIGQLKAGQVFEAEALFRVREWRQDVDELESVAPSSRPLIMPMVEFVEEKAKHSVSSLSDSVHKRALLQEMETIRSLYRELVSEIDFIKKDGDGGLPPIEAR